MNSKFSTSGVVTSGVDYFCLVCECRLHRECDAFAHIDKPVHTKKFQSTDYFEKKENYVRKINKWYFCELCSLLLPTAARVRLHVSEPLHSDKKTARALQRKGSCVVAFSQLQINDKAWNGIIDDICVICNREFDDQNIHINETDHIIKLIHNKVEFDVNKNIFRRVDESSFQCITCNMVIGLNSIDSHFNEIEHKTLYQSCCDAFEIAGSNEDEINEKTKQGNAVNISGSLKVVNDFKKLTLNSGETNDTEICQALGATEYIAPYKDGGKWCLLCNEELDGDISSHISDLHHQTILQLHKDRLKQLNAEENLIEPSKDMISKACTVEENVESKSNILDFVEEFQKNKIQINFEYQTAACKLCSIDLLFDKQAITDHIKEHLKNNDSKNITKSIEIETGLKDLNKEEVSSKKTLYTKPVLKNNGNIQELQEDEIDKSSDMVNIENYIKENDMTPYSGKGKVYCKKCNCNIPYSLRNLKEHVTGSGHQKIMNDKKTSVALLKTPLKQSDKKANLIKISISTFINSLYFAEHWTGVDIIINEKICTNFISLLLLVNMGNHLKCLLCNTNIDRRKWKQHIEMKKHDTVLDNCLVIIANDHDNEFIREIPSGSFHCGYCNLLHDSWDATERHLQSETHRESKASAEWRLRVHAPEINNQRLQKQMHEHIFRIMMNSMFAERHRSYYDSDSDSD